MSSLPTAPAARALASPIALIRMQYKVGLFQAYLAAKLHRRFATFTGRHVVHFVHRFVFHLIQVQVARE